MVVVVFLPCALLCDCGAFYKRLLFVLFGWCDGLRVRVVLLCSVSVGLCSVGLRLLSAVGVRMARIGFSAIDIYLYTDGVARDCGAFSCVCGGVGGLCCVYVWMYQGLFRVVWCIYVSIYLCIP